MPEQTIAMLEEVALTLMRGVVGRSPPSFRLREGVVYVGADIMTDGRGVLYRSPAVPVRVGVERDDDGNLRNTFAVDWTACEVCGEAVGPR